MKHLIALLLVLITSIPLFAQNDSIRKVRIVLGLSAPELIHVGLTYRIANVSQIGASFGIAASWLETVTALSLEHRFYFGPNSESTDQKAWFFRQGATYFPKRDESNNLALNLTLGKDFVFKNIRNGITFDAGVSVVPGQNDYSKSAKSTRIWPAIRFQLFFQ